MEPIVVEGQDDNRALVIDTTIQGIDALKPTRPRFFSDQALKSASDLVTLQGERIERIELFSNEARIECDEIIAANIRAILRREVLGSVARLEAMNSHSGFHLPSTNQYWASVSSVGWPPMRLRLFTKELSASTNIVYAFQGCCELTSKEKSGLPKSIR